MLNIHRLFTQLFCLMIGLFLFNHNAGAGTIDELNKAVVPLISQDSRSQQNAYRTALHQVLIKLTGDQSFTEHSEYDKLLGNAIKFVTSTEFVENQANQLLVIFNQELLERWIKRNGLPLWGAQRPEALVWFIEQSYASKERMILTDSIASDTKDILNQHLFNRGIQLDFPLMDIIDINLVSEIDIWGQFVDTLHEGAMRYKTPYTIGVRLVETKPDSWLLDYFVKSDTALRLQQLTGSDKTQLIQQFVNEYAQFQAEKYALDTTRFVDNTQIQHEVNISGVTDIMVLSEIENYLTSLSIVEKVQLTRQNTDTSTFNIKLIGSPEQLHQILLNGNKLVARITLDNGMDNFNRIGNDSHLDNSITYSYEWR